MWWVMMPLPPAAPCTSAPMSSSLSPWADTDRSPCRGAAGAARSRLDVLRVSARGGLHAAPILGGLRTLFARIRELKAAGVAILYVSHRLEEVKRLADRISVLRDGSLVASGSAADLSIDQIITAMVGRTIAEHYPKRQPRPIGATLLEVEDPDASACGGGVNARAGEIIGLARLVGSGRSEWALALFSGKTKGV